MKRRVALMGFNSERVIHWPHIKRKMQENYSKMNKEQQEFTDWFLTYDFVKEKKKALYKYYVKNFFGIVKH